jgi:agmatine/peptidylarginine deiminase
MIFTDYSKVQNLILAYPERFYNKYERLVQFYDELIHIIPNQIQLWLLTNNNATKLKLEGKYRYKKLNVIGIKGWDDIWLRDCIGINTNEQVVKPFYYPQYCALPKYRDYFENINKLSRIIIKECLQKRITYLPLIIDGGNFLNNNTSVFITDKVLEDNRELSKSEIFKILRDFIPLNPIIVERSRTDVVGHMDGFLHFIGNNRVLLSNYPSLPFLKEDIYFLFKLRKRLEEERLEIIDLYDRPVDEIVKCECYNLTKKPCFYSARGIISIFFG